MIVLALAGKGGPLLLVAVIGAVGAIVAAMVSRKK
jgi:hypothetical protein